jgi:hypothetical protein
MVVSGNVKKMICKGQFSVVGTAFLTNHLRVTLWLLNVPISNMTQKNGSICNWEIQKITKTYNWAVFWEFGGNTHARPRLVHKNIFEKNAFTLVTNTLQKTWQPLNTTTCNWTESIFYFKWFCQDMLNRWIVKATSSLLELHFWPSISGFFYDCSMYLYPIQTKYKHDNHRTMLNCIHVLSVSVGTC